MSKLPVSPLSRASLVVGCLLVSVGAGAADRGNLSLSAELGFEYDDNVSVSALDQNTGLSDQALVFDFSANYQLFKDEQQELELSYDFSQTAYESLDEYDLQIHTFGASGSRAFEDYDLGLGYSYSRVYLGGSELYSSHALTPSVSFFGIPGWYHRLSYGYQNKDFDHLSARDADQHSIAADNYWFFMDNRAHVSVGLRYEDENTTSPEYDYSAVYLKFGVVSPLPAVDPELKLEANYQHYWRDYDNVTLSIGEPRNDRQGRFGLSLTRPVYGSLNAKLSYEHTGTDSNLPSADSTENVYRASVVADF